MPTTETMVSNLSPTLGYARENTPRRPRWFRLALLAIVLLTLPFALPPAVGYLVYIVPVYRLQRQCLAYVAAPDQMVYDETVLAAARIKEGSGYRRFPRCGVFHVPAAWHTFRGSYDCPDGTAFLHARTSPTGETRLVAVDLVPEAMGEVGFRASVIKPAYFFDRAGLEAARATKGVVQFTLKSDPAEPIRIFAGQPDTNDASCFTIRCQRGDRPLNVIGQLQPDGSVLLKEQSK